VTNPLERQSAPRSPEDASIWVRAEEDELRSLAFLGGLVHGFSRGAPSKETPNEDAAAVIPFGPDSGLLAVADGLGGTRGGDQASAITIYELCAALEHAAQQGDSLREAVLDGIEAANREIGALAIGAASTVAVVELRGNQLRPYHVGDSEILVVGGRGKVKLQTVSHSPMGYAIESGLIGEYEALYHADRHLVFNVVGVPEMRIEVGAAIELAPRDTVLVASDGLFDNLTIDEIVEALVRPDLGAGVAALVDVCRDRMATMRTGAPHKPDDLSLLVWRREEPA